MRTAPAPIVPKDAEETAEPATGQDTANAFIPPDLAASLLAILASLRVWLVATFATLLDLFPNNSPITRAVACELRAHLRLAERDAKIALLGLAMARLAPQRQAPRTRHPAPGYALRRWRASHLRLLIHGVFHARPHTLRLRIDRLRDMLDRPERWIARLLKRLRRGFDGAHAVLAAPPLVRPAPLRPVAPALADSS
ncbi:MAG: hypothetical protein JNJ73_06780 [Hyphomonadaceae bacterium]|nr:hypothetical protein [Hyphomonadaceae bacterium]